MSKGVKVFTPKEKRRLKNLVRELKKQRALHTEFVSVYIPAGYDISKIINHLSDEQGTASNIKSAVTRKNVQNALEKMIQTLKGYKATPKNGFAVFAGNLGSKDGKQDFHSWSYSPPVPLNIRIYRCDKVFVTEHLEELLMDKRVYGLVVMDRRDANIALLKGKTIVPLQKTHSEVPGKFRAGGQSAQRFARLREGAAKQHYKKVAEYMKDQFLHLGNDLLGIIIGGPGTTVGDFMNKDYVTGDLKKKIIGTKDLSYTGDFGLQELLEKSEDLLAEEEVAREKKIMQKFLLRLVKDEHRVSYGKEQVEKAMTMGAVDVLLLSEEVVSEEVIQEYEDLAEESGCEVRVISGDTREGVQLKNLGGYAAILRFAIN
jgi:peptide chain release factor subunit 1